MATSTLREGERKAVQIAWAHLYEFHSMRSHTIANDFRRVFPLVRKQHARCVDDAKGMIVKYWLKGATDIPSMPAHELYDVPEALRLVYMLGAHIGERTHYRELKEIVGKCREATALYDQARFRNDQKFSRVDNHTR